MTTLHAEFDISLSGQYEAAYKLRPDELKALILESLRDAIGDNEDNLQANNLKITDITDENLQRL